MEEDTFEETYNLWSEQEEEWLWEQYQQGKTIDDICRGLSRYPDDIIIYIATRSNIKPEDIKGFGGPCHLALWKQQQKDFETNPLFNLRKEIRQEEFENKMYKMLLSLYLNKLNQKQ